MTISRLVFATVVAATCLFGVGQARAQDCAGGEIYDDGVAEEVLPVAGRFVQRFTPASYPGGYAAVCICLFRTDPNNTSLDFNIVAYDDDGPGGGPGTSLGSIPALAAVVPNTVPGQFYSYDISSLGLSLANGSVYLGADWGVQGFAVCTDTSGQTPSGAFLSLANQTAWSSNSPKVFQIRALPSAGGETPLPDDDESAGAASDGGAADRDEGTAVVE